MSNVIFTERAAPCAAMIPTGGFDMKRMILKLALLIGLLCLAAALLAACGGWNVPAPEPDDYCPPPTTLEPSHVHNFGEWETLFGATCLNPGKEYRTCSCGEREYREVPALGHDIVGLACTRCRYALDDVGLLMEEDFEGGYIVTGLGMYSDPDLVIPNTFRGCPITGIGKKAFAGCDGIKTVTMPVTVTWIGDEAFRDCEFLNTVTIAEGVKTIGLHAFASCSSLRTVYWNAEECTAAGGFNDRRVRCLPFDASYQVGTVVFGEKVKRIPDYAFYKCEKLQSVTFNEGLEYIGEFAFCACSALRTTALPETLKEIGRSAFAYGKFRSVTIPERLTRIGKDAFTGCNSIKTVYWNAEKGFVENGFPFSHIESIVFGENVKIIPDNMFAFCTGLRSIVIPDTVTSIGNRAFYNCGGLESVTIPESVTSIGDCAFDGCTNLKEIVIPQSVTFVGRNAFARCMSLKSVVIPEGVTELYGTFSECTALESVSLPNSVVEIGYSTFSGCTALESLTVPEGVVSIGENGFSGCTALKELTLPESITLIGRSAFAGCEALERINYAGSEEQWSAVTVRVFENGVLDHVEMIWNCAG